MCMTLHNSTPWEHILPEAGRTTQNLRPESIRFTSRENRVPLESRERRNDSQCGTPPTKMIQWFIYPKSPTWNIRVAHKEINRGFQKLPLVNSNRGSQVFWLRVPLSSPPPFPSPRNRDTKFVPRKVLNHFFFFKFYLRFENRLQRRDSLQHQYSYRK